METVRNAIDKCIRYAPDKFCALKAEYYTKSDHSPMELTLNSISLSYEYCSKCLNSEKDNNTNTY